MIDGITLIAGEERLRPVGGRAEESGFADASRLEENDMKSRGKSELAFVSVKPDTHRIDFRFSLVPLDVVGLAENDVNSAPVGLPAWSRPLPTKKSLAYWIRR